MKTKRNVENDRLTVRIDSETKREMAEMAERFGVSLAWIVKHSWKKSKDSIAKMVEEAE